MSDDHQRAVERVRAWVDHKTPMVSFDDVKAVLDALAEFSEHLKGSWPKSKPHGFGRVWGCRYCDAPFNADPSAETKHTTECPLRLIP